jgi:hypothetical protein
MYAWSALAVVIGIVVVGLVSRVRDGDVGDAAREAVFVGIPIGIAWTVGNAIDARRRARRQRRSDTG